MLNYEEEKRDMESFIDAGVKQLSAPQKQRLADILLGMRMAEEEAHGRNGGPKYSIGGVPAQCG